MANQEEVLNAMRLVTEYYQAQPNETQVRLWIRLLEPYPAEIIESAVLAHIEHSKWQPKVSEVRDLCAELMPKNSYQVDSMAGQLIELENAFYDDRRLDAAAWEGLAQSFERCGRQERGVNTRQRLANLQAVLEREQQPC